MSRFSGSTNWTLADVVERLNRVEAKLDLLIEKEAFMSAELDRLAQDVTSLTDVAAGVETTLGSLSQQIKTLAASGGTPAQFTQLADQIDAAKKRIADAITANTAAAPAPATPNRARP